MKKEEYEKVVEIKVVEERPISIVLNFGVDSVNDVEMRVEQKPTL